MARQVRLLRQLCVVDMKELTRRFDLVEQPYPSDRNETYDTRIKRILEEAYDEYNKAHNDMRQRQWDALVAQDAKAA